MDWFIGSNNVLDAVTDSGTLVKSAPRLEHAFDHLKDLRSADDGSIFRGQEFRRVASLMAPLLNLAEVLEPGFLDKKTFYAWLDRHPEYCTYDRRKNKLRSDFVTFVDGKEVS